MGTDDKNPSGDSKAILSIKDTRILFPGALFLQTIFLVWYIAHRDAQLDAATASIARQQVTIEESVRRTAALELARADNASRINRLEASDDLKTRLVNDINQQLARIDERLRFLIEKMVEAKK